MTTTKGRKIQVVVVAVVAALAIVVTPLPARAAEDLVLSGVTTYRVDLEESEVDVHVEYSVRNNKPSTRRGSTITRYYFDTVFFLLPRGAEDVSVTSGGREVEFGELLEEGTRYLEMELPSRLFYRQTRTLDISFSLDGSRLGQTDLVRVNPAHLTMWAWVWGDPGQTDVRIEIPRGFQLDWFGSDGAIDLLRLDRGDPDLDVWLAEAIEDPEAWWVSAVGDRPSALAVEEFEIDGIELEVRSWPGEPTWYADITGTLDTGLAALVDAVGLEWPVDDALVLSQSSVPNRVGYGGWYFTELDEIEIGEDVDELLVLHEVSHAWFNDTLFEERWIGEGLADAISAHVLRDTFGLAEFPTVTNRSSSAAIVLNSWMDPTLAPDPDDEEVEQELWAYNASYWVIHQLIDEIGIDGIRDVLRAADADEIAYRGAVTPEEATPGADDWRRFLDLLEEVGGSESASELFLDHVVNEFWEDDLERRAGARQAYARLGEVAGWAMPIYVRQSMEDWKFADAQAALDQLGDFIDLRDTHEIESVENGFVLHDFQHGFETVEGVGDIDAMEDRVDIRRHAIEAWMAARYALGAPRDLATIVGLNELADPGLTLLEAHRAFNDHDPQRSIELSERVHLELAFAAAVGQERIDDVVVGLYGLLALLGVAVLWGVIRLRRSRAASKLGPAPGSVESATDDPGFVAVSARTTDGPTVDTTACDDHETREGRGGVTSEISGVGSESDVGNEPLDRDGDVGEET